MRMKNSKIKELTEVQHPDHSRSRLLKVAISGTGVQVMNIVCAMLALTVCQWYWGDEGVGLYTQMRRVSSLLVPFLIIGQNNALTHYLAIAYDDRKKQMELSATCSLVTMLVFGVFGIFVLFDPLTAARWILGNKEFSSIMGPFAISLIGKGMGEVGGAYLRGRFRYITVQVSSMVFSGAISFFVLLAFSGFQIKTVLWIIAGLQFLVGLSFAGYYLLRGIAAGAGFLRRFWSYVYILYGYGIVRLPAAGLTMLLLGFVSWQFANKSGLENLGFFNSMTSVAMTLNIVAISMSFTLLPLFSLRLKQKGVSGCTRFVETLLMAGFTTGLFFSLQMLLFGTSCTQVLLQRFVDVPLWWGVVYGLTLGLILFNITDRLLNAYATFPFSLIGLSAGVVNMYIVWWLGSQWINSLIVLAGASVAIGYLTLGIVSAGITAKVYGVGIPGLRQWTGVAWAIAVFGLGLMEYLWTKRLPINWRAWTQVGLFTVNTGIFAAGLLAFRIPWVIHITAPKKSLPAGANFVAETIADA